MHDHEEQHEAALRRARLEQRRPGPSLEPSPRRVGAPLSATSVLGLQRSVGNAGTVALVQDHEHEGAAAHAAHSEEPSEAKQERSPVHDTIKSGGSPLDPATRTDMEAKFGEGFGDVRLHVDAPSAESVRAAAYTVGNDIVVHPSHFTPGTPSAQRTLAHELTHVVQQRQGPVAGTEAPGGIRLSDPGDRFEREAEAKADTVMSQMSPTSPGKLAASASGQGQEDVQRLVVQREEEDEAEGEE